MMYPSLNGSAGADRVRVFALLSACLAVSTVSTMQESQAQDIRNLPQQPAQTQPSGTVAPPSVAAIAAPDKNKVIVPSLRGIRLIDAVSKVSSSPQAGVSIEGAVPGDDTALRAALNARIGQPLTFGGLDEISHDVVQFYRENNRPLVDVSFPEQDMQSGVLQAVVTQFHVGDVRVEGNHYFDAAAIRSQIRVKSGDVIDPKTLDADLLWLNQNPFRHVDVVLERSKQKGATDIVIRTEEKSPWRVYASTDNSGTPVTSHQRYTAGVNWGAVFGTDQQASYQFTTSAHNAPAGGYTFNAHSATYMAPLPWRDRLTVFGVYATQQPILGPSLTQKGKSSQLSLRYATPLNSWGRVAHELQFGYDFKSTNNNLEFGGTQVFNSTTHVHQFLFIYNGAAPDETGTTTFENQLVFSPGDFSGKNSDAAFAANTAFAKSRYAYDRLTVTRTQRLPKDTTLFLRFIGQIADNNLLSTETLGAGGMDTVRGYQEHQVSGANGVLLTAELRSPSFGVFLKNGALKDSAQLLAFVDYGHVRDKIAQPGLPPSADLQSAGVGVRYSVGPNLTLRFDYGWQMRKAPGATDKGSFGHLALTLAY